MKPLSDGGKGSSRRQEDVKKIHDNWDLIFGNKKKKDTTMNDTHDDIEDEDDLWEICPACNGSGEGMYDGSRCYKCKGYGEIRTQEDDKDDYYDYED